MPEQAEMPRDNLYRELQADFDIRASEDEGHTLAGHFARFNEWTEIDSIFEGRFMERFSAGAFKKTIKESRDKMKVLFQHGRDPSVGDKPIGQIRELREDGEGAYYEARLFDGLPKLLEEGLRANQYGASFRFQVVHEDVVKTPERGDHNPHGLPERTVKEAIVREFGPVTFPAYGNATAGMRSATDRFRAPSIEELRERLLDTPEQRLAFFDHLMGVDDYRAEFFARMVDDPNDLRSMIETYLAARSEDEEEIEETEEQEARSTTDEVETPVESSRSPLGGRDSDPLYGAHHYRRGSRKWQLS